MPSYRLTVQLAGVTITTWTQDPDGLGASYRDAGAFVSGDTPREDPPLAQLAT
jgi:hypothetical protein